MAKKPAKIPADSLTAIAGLGVEISIVSDKIDALASRVGTSERRLDDAKAVPLHLIQLKQEVADIRAAVERIEQRRWWRFWA